MPLRYSRRTRRPRMSRRRRVLRRRVYRTRRLRRQPVHIFKRSKQSTLTLSSITPNAEYSFKLSDVTQYTEFTSLFDQYKISAIRLQILPKFNSIDNTSSKNFNIYTVIDRTDNSALGNATDALEYQSMKMTPYTRRHVRYFKPSVLVNVMDDTTTDSGAYQPKMNQWIATDFPEITHYGIKLITDQNVTGNTEFTVLTTYYFALKNVK